MENEPKIKEKEIENFTASFLLSEFRKDIRELRTEFRNDIAEVRASFSNDVKSNFRLIISVQLVTMLTVIGTLLTIILTN